MDGGALLSALRARLKTAGVDAFIIPHADRFQNEYLPPSEERLRFIAGFTGSAGTAVVTRDDAALFVDGRYTIQAAQEVDAAHWDVFHTKETTALAWLGVKKGITVGYDPLLHTVKGVEDMRRILKKTGGSLRQLENIVDAIWADRPAPKVQPLIPHLEEYAGVSSSQKRLRAAVDLSDARQDVFVVTDPASLSWLLNIRGQDVPHNPVALGYGLLFADGQFSFFADPGKVTDDLRAHLDKGVSIASFDDFEAALRGLSGQKVRVDYAKAPMQIWQILTEAEAEVRNGKDPSLLLRACKNPAEIKGARDAQLRDGLAVTRFLCWLETEIPTGTVTEIAASDKLEAFRREDPLCRDLSFGTISAAGDHGAIVHYQATQESDKKIEPGMLYLCDSGGQYPDGTTDITRTICVGTPTDEQKEHFTRVLKGHIALADLTFPAGRSGKQLDALARVPLWEAGLDYDHGTGHGIGAYLSVHEGPQSISPRGGETALQVGMLLSNEPGYYKEGAYGIRLENVLLVLPAEGEEGREFLSFETLTLAPFDARLIDLSLLTESERAWLNAYHERVFDAHEAQLSDAERIWLKKATAPI